MSFHTGINSISITADISKSDDVQRMIDNIVSKWGTIHIACNNAGINMNSASEDTSLEEWDQTFDVNLRGTFMCCQVCVCVCVWGDILVWHFVINVNIVLNLSSSFIYGNCLTEKKKDGSLMKITRVTDCYETISAPKNINTRLTSAL